MKSAHENCFKKVQALSGAKKFFFSVTLCNQSNKFPNITKKCITKKSRNSKLKEKCCINEKAHLDTEKEFVLQHSLKINKRLGDGGREGGGGVLISTEGLEKTRKINKRLPVY